VTRAWGLFWSGWFMASVLEAPTALRAIGLAVSVLLAAMARDRSETEEGERK